MNPTSISSVSTSISTSVSRASRSVPGSNSNIIVGTLFDFSSRAPRTNNLNRNRVNGVLGSQQYRYVFSSSKQRCSGSTGTDSPADTDKNVIFINDMPYRIPYKDCIVSSVFETNKVPLNLDCRQGICKSCRITAKVDGQDVEILACQEPCSEGMRISVDMEQTARAIAEKVSRSMHSFQNKEGRVLSKYQKSGDKDKAIMRIKFIKETRNKVEDYVWMLDDAMGDYEMEKECIDGMEETLKDVDDEIMTNNIRHGGRANMLETFYLLLSYSSFPDIKERALKRHNYLMHLYYPGGIPPEDSSSPSRDQKWLGKSN